jgi:hypothetical protein
LIPSRLGRGTQLGDRSFGDRSLRVEGEGRVNIKGNLEDIGDEQNEKSNKELDAGQSICSKEMEEP